MDDISKSFSGVNALSGVSLEIRAGEVLALLGENGAGKSTLLKILSGDYQPDAGRIVVTGEPVSFSGPSDAHRAGIRVINQEPEIIGDVSVAENVYVGALPRRGRLFDRRGIAARLRADLDETGFASVLRPGLLGRDLSPAQRQLVEIMRALQANPRLVAFDEPTSSLTDHEVDALFALIARLRERGVAIVYVSHRLNEIFRLADRVAVLRDGALVGVNRAAETDPDELVRMMVGRDLTNVFSRDAHEPGAVMLRVSDLTSDDITDVSLEVRAREVVGLAGLIGAGRSELVRAIVGDLPITSGTVEVDGATLRLRTPRDAIRAGIGFAPEERKADGLLMQRTVRDNISISILDRLRRFRFVRRAEERRVVSRFVNQLNVRTPSIEQEVRKLSGGNQQKIVLARWLARKPKVLILDEPTRGVDVGAKAEIFAIIHELARDGVAVLFISSELPEVLSLADRILVMGGGRLTGELARGEATEERILTLAMSNGPTATTGANPS